MAISEKYNIKAGKSCLMVIDIQEKLFAVMDENTRAIVERNAGILLRTADEFSIPVLVTEQYKKGLGPTIASLSEQVPEYSPLDKTYFSCAREERVFNELKKFDRQTVIICGMETHICVLTTVMDLLEKKYNVVIASDGVCSRQNSNRDWALKSMHKAGAVIYPTETIVFMIMECSGTEKFKKLAPLFKEG